MEALPDLDSVVTTADLILSILPPAGAPGLAKQVAAAMKRTGVRPAYADCNAVSPATVRAIAAEIEKAGAPFIDAGIVGPAPVDPPPTRFYVSGADCTHMDALSSPAVAVRGLGSEVGRASGLKMCYAALTKGTWTLQTALLMAAASLGVAQELETEFSESQASALALMRSRIPRLPADAARWVGEMEEISATFEAAGVTGKFHDGAAEIFRLLAKTPFAEETRENMDRARTLEDTIAALLDGPARGHGS